MIFPQEQLRYEVEGEEMGYKKLGTSTSFADLAVNKSLKNNRCVNPSGKSLNKGTQRRGLIHGIFDQSER
jgi:hypothetical protein